MASAKLYGNFIISSFKKEIDIFADTIKAALCTSSYVPSQHTHNYFDDITNEVTGTGYTSGGKALTNVTCTLDPATGIITINADDLIWDNCNIVARYLIFYDDTPSTAGTKPLIGYIDFGENVTSTSDIFKLTWPSSGIIPFEVA